MTLVVRIFQHDFPIEREYTEGHTLTAGEASAMNQLLIENIRNNVSGWVMREAKGSAVLTAEQHSDLAARISEYASRYQFRTRVRARPMNPLDATTRELALQHAETWGNKMGFGPDSPEVHEKYISLRYNPQIQEEARRLILQRQEALNSALIGVL